MKNPLKRMNEQTTDWEKMSANHLSDKRLVSRVYEGLPTLNNRKNIYNSAWKWARDMNKSLNDKGIEMVNKYMKRC